MMDTLEKKISHDFIDKHIDGIRVVQADNFEYKDPIDGSIAKKQVAKLKIKKYKMKYLLPLYISAISYIYI